MPVLGTMDMEYIQNQTLWMWGYHGFNEFILYLNVAPKIHGMKLHDPLLGRRIGHSSAAASGIHEALRMDDIQGGEARGAPLASHAGVDGETRV
eukprot:9488202-Pyramimonas_sp.AAC.1